MDSVWWGDFFEGNQTKWLGVDDLEGISWMITNYRVSEGSWSYHLWESRRPVCGEEVEVEVLSCVSSYWWSVIVWTYLYHWTSCKLLGGWKWRAFWRGGGPRTCSHHEFVRQFRATSTFLRYPSNASKTYIICPNLQRFYPPSLKWSKFRISVQIRQPGRCFIYFQLHPT